MMKNKTPMEIEIPPPFNSKEKPDLVLDKLFIGSFSTASNLNTLMTNVK